MTVDIYIQCVDGALYFAKALLVNMSVTDIDLSNNSIRLSSVNEVKRVLKHRNSDGTDNFLSISLEGVHVLAEVRRVKFLYWTDDRY